MVGGRAGSSFTVQKHAASHLHYDFRLELDGVLKSWAVPKGPSLDPSVKRLAVAVEDHPVSYGTFEGTIPQGEYGGGTVMLWDHGTWEPTDDPRAGLEQGKLKFTLHGEKLHGGWTLVRGGGGRQHSKRDWLLIKSRDAEARNTDEFDVLTAEDASVSTGREMQEIAAGRKPRKVAAKQSRSGKKRIGKKYAFPRKIEVQLATLTDAAPTGDEWFHEIKFDGYRMVCFLNDKHARMVTRNQQDWTDKFPEIVAAVGRLPVNNAVLDGEVVALRDDGTTDFQDLQNAFRDSSSAQLVYYIFDLLYLDGVDLRGEALSLRKEKLRDLLASEKANSRLRYSDHVVGQGQDFLKQAEKQSLEGIVCKRSDRPYQSGRTYDWVKVKCLHREEFVIGGFTDPQGARLGFGALLLGYFDKSQHLHYVGKVGTGFDNRLLKPLRQQLESLERKSSPFGARDLDKIPASRRHWVQPKLVAQIAYGSRTRDGILRHSSFQGLREDKPAGEVMDEQPKSATVVRRKTKSKAAKSAKRPASASASDVTSNGTGAGVSGVHLTSPDRVLYPQLGITKRELAEYFEAVAGWMLPHVARRPMSVVRCPEGQAKTCFFQKHPVRGTPEDLPRIAIREKKETEDYLYVTSSAHLVELAQMSALEIHAWGSRIDKLEHPDRLVFDLDPSSEVSWKTVVACAKEVRAFLQELGLETFVKTTGGKGLHLVAPIARSDEWDDVKTFCEQVATAIATARPDMYTANLSKKARTDKVFIDYLRNGRGATAVVPYSPRARDTASVSMPLAWEELSAKLPSDHFTLRNTLKRLRGLKADPWQEIDSLKQRLTHPAKKLAKLTNSG
jgi:bifunctional non-homologous end joining protein LigD